MAADAQYPQVSPGRSQDERKLLVPNHIADVLPPEPARKLEVAQGIINAAFRQQAAEMGGELQRLRMGAADKDSRIRILESRLAECQDTLRDTRSQLQTSLEQNDALQSERASLTNSLRKLEAFKRNLLHTLQASDVVIVGASRAPRLCVESRTRQWAAWRHMITHVQGTEGAGTLSSGAPFGDDRDDRWARQKLGGDSLQAHVPKGSGITAQTPLSKPDSYQQNHLSGRGHDEKSARQLEDSSLAPPLNGHGLLHSQPNCTAAPVRSPGGDVYSPLRRSEHAECCAAQQHADPTAARRASHNGTYQTRDLPGLSLGDTGLSSLYNETLGRSHIQPEPRAVSGGNDSLLHIPSDMQSIAEGHASYPGHEGPLPNGGGDTGRLCHGHGNHVHSPRNTHDVSYQAPGGYAAGSAQPHSHVYNEAVNDRPLRGEGYLHSATALPAQEGPQAKDRSEGREFFRRARARLSNEAFSAFLQAIKDMNAGVTGRSETLQTAADIFAGPDADLYHDFKALLDSHLPSK